MATYVIDQASLDLILELQLQDVEGLLKGKYREGKISDAEFAAGLYKAEIESSLCSFSDQELCRSIANAVLSDGNLIKEHVDAELEAAQDRQDALSWHLENRPPRAVPEEAVLEDEMLSKLIALYIGSQETAGDPQGSSDVFGSTSTANAAYPRRDCVACQTGSRAFDILQCPCSHDYCRECIENLFEACLSDETLFPPRCCGQTISLESVQGFLPSKLVGLYRAKELEYNTPNRTYCHVSECSTFIPPPFIRDQTATCLRCSETTCILCKNASHADECPDDAKTLEVLEIAKSCGWQRCFSCRSMVELDTGCNHITCRCGAEFCYVCAMEWKNCPCDQWDENRLVTRANAIVDRDAGGHDPPLGRARDLRVEHERRHLMANHECTHEGWRSRRGAFQCEECHHMLPEFIYECRTCRIQACRRCRYNRL